MTTAIKAVDAPYQDPSANRIYDLLFCDRAELFAANNKAADEYPWKALLAKDTDPAGLQEIIADESLESRLRLLAYNKLAKAGFRPATKEMLGVVIEVGLDDGLDVVAAYADGTARYINASGKMIIWDSVTPESAALVGSLFQQGQTVVEKIGPWDGERRTHPFRGMVRLSFLVSDGLYFGEGSQQALFNDAMAGPVLVAALKLVQYLTETVLEKNV